MAALSDIDHGGVHLLRWSPSDNSENFGDYLGPAIVARLAGPVHLGLGERLWSVGSVIHFAEPGDHVWGSGLNPKVRPTIPPHAGRLFVHATRGPLTRLALLAAGVITPPIFGDPALLFARAFPEFSAVSQRRRPRVVIPNLNDVDVFADEPDLVQPTGDPWNVIEAIAQAELVVGTSLHAIVVAEALGIPARFVRSPHEHPWKYHDYLAGTGRTDETPAATVDEATSLGGYPTPNVDLDALEHALPVELWHRGTADDTTVLPYEVATTSDIDEAVHLIQHFGDPRFTSDIRLQNAISELIAMPMIRRFSISVADKWLGPLVQATTELLSVPDVRTVQPDWRHADGTASDLRLVRRVAARDHRGAAAWLDLADAGEDGSLSLCGTGFAAAGLAGATYAFAVAVHSTGEIDLPARCLDIAADHPEFRWTLDLSPVDIPDAVVSFGLRIDWQDGHRRIKGARVKVHVGQPDNQVIQAARLWLLHADTRGNAAFKETTQ